MQMERVRLVAMATESNFATVEHKIRGIVYIQWKYCKRRNMALDARKCIASENNNHNSPTQINS